MVLTLVLTLVLHAVLAAEPEVPVPPGASRLEWSAPAGCPEAARGADELERFLGGRAPSVPARVELAAVAQGYAATVTVGRAARTLHASDCETLARAAVLVVAVSLDPVAAVEAVETVERSDEAAEPPPPVSAIPERGASGLGTAEPDAPRLAPSARRTGGRRGDSTRARAVPPAHWLGASGGPSLAIVPALTGVVHVGYTYERQALQLRAGVTYATPRVITYPDSTLGGRIQSLTFGAHACLAPSTRRVTLPICAGLESGPIFGRGVGVADSRRPVGAWVGAVAGGSARLRVRPRLALSLGADVIASLWRHAFHVEDRGTLFVVPLVGLRGLAGVEVRLR